MQIKDGNITAHTHTHYITSKSPLLWREAGVYAASLTDRVCYSVQSRLFNIKTALSLGKQSSRRLNGGRSLKPMRETEAVFIPGQDAHTETGSAVYLPNHSTMPAPPCVSCQSEASERDDQRARRLCRVPQTGAPLSRLILLLPS